MFRRRIPGEIPFESVIVNFGFPVKILIRILWSSQIIKIVRIDQGEIAEQAVVEDVIPAQCNSPVSKTHPGKLFIGISILTGIARQIDSVLIIDAIVHFSIKIVEIELCITHCLILGEEQEDVGIGSSPGKKK